MYSVTRAGLIATALSLSLSACGGGGGGGGGGGNGQANNLAPTATISVSDTGGYAPLSLTFDGSQSSDGDGNVTAYSWDFGDGSSSLGSQANHTYTTLGVFTATLTVTDDDGASSTTSVSIDSHAQIAGIYTGSIYSAVTQTFTEVEVIIGANHEIFAYDWFNYQTAYWGSLNMATASATGTLFAEIWDPAVTFPDGTIYGTVNATVDVRPKQDVIGTYSGVGDAGTIQVDYDSAVAEIPSSLNDIGGTWFFADGFGYTATLVVSSLGDLDYSDTDGWVGVGQIQVLDPDLNGYSFQWDWSHPDPANDGPTGGIAYLYDGVPGERWLVFAEWWDALPGSYDAGGDIWHMPRPVPMPAVNANAATFKTSARVARPGTAGKRRQIRGQ